MHLSCAEQMLGARSLQEKLVLIRDGGFDGIDGRYETFADAANRRAITESGLPIGAMYSQIREPGLLSRSAADRAKGVDLVVERAMLAAEIGARCMIVVPIFGVPKLAGFDPVLDVRLVETAFMLTMLAEIAARLADVPITITLEPLNADETHFLTVPAEAARWCAAIGSSRVATMVDTYHCERNGQEIPATIAAVGDHLALVHLSDDERQLPGDGRIDFGPILAALHARGYDGWMGFECRPNTVTEEGLGRSVRYLRDLWERNEGAKV
ncbi:MAG: sugar phosphate isomerase/epimerase family protein [Thermomicrobiales bacterium]